MFFCSLYFNEIQKEVFILTIHKLNLHAEVQYTHTVPNESPFYQPVQDSNHSDLAFSPKASSYFYKYAYRIPKTIFPM
jgi:hypothetical protein